MLLPHASVSLPVSLTPAGGWEVTRCSCAQGLVQGRP